MGFIPYGSMIFAGHPKDLATVLTFESERTISVHPKGV